LLKPYQNYLWALRGRKLFNKARRGVSVVVDNAAPVQELNDLEGEIELAEENPF
jgi:hypothetical protein